MTYQEMVNSYQKDLEEFKNEPYCRRVRLRVLYEQLFELEDELYTQYRDYRLSQENDRPYIERALIAYPIPGIVKQIKRITMAIRCMDISRQDDITPDMIINARQYPIEHIIQVKRNFASCPAHEDTKPSLYTKNNFGYCFSCGYSGDVIDIAMKTKGMNFREAVKWLQCQ